MAYGESTAWWADVQHLRDDDEHSAAARHRGGEAAARTARNVTITMDPPQRAEAMPERRPDAMPARRTVEIRGRTVPAPPVATARAQDGDRRGPQRLSGQRVVARPDRLALWALLMGLVLILVAIGTAGGSGVAGLIVP